MPNYEFIYFIAAGSLGALGGLIFAAWGTGKFYDAGKISRGIAVCTGLVFAGCSGYFAYLATESKILTGLIGFLGGTGGAAAMLWWITKNREPAKFHKLTGAAALSIVSFLFAGTLSGVIALGAVSKILKTHIQPAGTRTSAAPVCVQRLRMLCLAQKNYKNINGKYATLETLSESRFFNKELLDPVSNDYELKVEIPGKDNWTCFAAPRLPESKLPVFRIDETGIVRFRRDGTPPTKEDPAYCPE